MKPLKVAILSILTVGLLAAPLASFADDAKDSGKDADAKKPKPYTLKKCPVSGDKLGEMGDPFVFVYKDKKIKDDTGREIKLCCKSCKKDFDKDSAKFIKQIEKDEAKAAKSEKSGS